MQNLKSRKYLRNSRELLSFSFLGGSPEWTALEWMNEWNELACVLSVIICVLAFLSFVDVFSGFFLCYGILVALNEAGFLRCATVLAVLICFEFFCSILFFILILWFFEQFLFTGLYLFKWWFNAGNPASHSLLRLSLTATELFPPIHFSRGVHSVRSNDPPKCCPHDTRAAKPRLVQVWKLERLVVLLLVHRSRELRACVHCFSWRSVELVFLFRCFVCFVQFSSRNVGGALPNRSKRSLLCVCFRGRKSTRRRTFRQISERELREEVVINFPSLLRQFIKLFVRLFPARGVWRASGCLLFLQANSPFRFVRRRSRSTLAAVRVTGSLGTPTWIAGFLGKKTRENQAAAAKLDAGTGSNPLVERRA